jgi:hypothetical protein
VIVRCLQRGSVTHERWIATLVALLVALCLGMPAHAQAVVQNTADYDPTSSSWNGLVEVIRLAQLNNVQIRPTPTLDWSHVRRGDGLLVLYPLSQVDLDELSAFLEDGGRLALFDDFGAGEPVMRWFQVTRSEAVRGQLRSAHLPGLYTAFRQGDHILGEQVDSVVTNEPVMVRHPRLSPVFALGPDPDQGVILAGQVGRGRLVISGDPSVLLNSMLRFPGNRQFAANLLKYLATDANARVHLVYGRFASKGTYPGAHTRSRSPLKMFSKHLDETLQRAGSFVADPSVLRLFGVLAVLLSALMMAAKMWGAKPSDRFGPTAPSGALVGVAAKVALFGREKANLLYPTLILRRMFERGLLRALGLTPPTDILAVAAKAEKKLSEESIAQLRAVLLELDTIAQQAEERATLKVSPRRFVSLWRRISAILAQLRESAENTARPPRTQDRTVARGS